MYAKDDYKNSIKVPVIRDYIKTSKLLVLKKNLLETMFGQHQVLTMEKKLKLLRYIKI